MWVEIDDDLALAIEEQMALGESREQVVHRLLLEALRRTAAIRKPAARTRVVVSGSMRELLEAGLIAEDDEIRHTEIRRGVVHTGRIDAEGRIHTDKGVDTSPSTALTHLVNYSINGWTAWTHVATGKPLAALRTQMLSQRQALGTRNDSQTRE